MFRPHFGPQTAAHRLDSSDASVRIPRVFVHPFRLIRSGEFKRSVQRQPYYSDPRLTPLEESARHGVDPTTSHVKVVVRVDREVRALADVATKDAVEVS